jgi:hypothetical protein
VFSFLFILYILPLHVRCTLFAYLVDTNHPGSLYNNLVSPTSGPFPANRSDRRPQLATSLNATPSDLKYRASLLHELRKSICRQSPLFPVSRRLADPYYSDATSPWRVDQAATEARYPDPLDLLTLHTSVPMADPNNPKWHGRVAQNL